MDKLRQGKVRVRNWHALNWENQEQISKKRSVDKRGAKSDEAYVRDVLEEMSGARNILVINDEAHHAWRTSAGTTTRGIDRAEVEQATKVGRWLRPNSRGSGAYWPVATFRLLHSSLPAEQPQRNHSLAG